MEDFTVFSIKDNGAIKATNGELLGFFDRANQDLHVDGMMYPVRCVSDEQAGDIIAWYHKERLELTKVGG